MTASSMSSPVRSRVSMSGASSSAEQAMRLLAQDVLAGFQGANAPLDVQVVGERDVDRLDRRVREQRLRSFRGRREPARLGQHRRHGRRRARRSPARRTGCRVHGRSRVRARSARAENSPERVSRDAPALRTPDRNSDTSARSRMPRTTLAESGSQRGSRDTPVSPETESDTRPDGRPKRVRVDAGEHVRNECGDRLGVPH